MYALRVAHKCIDNRFDLFTYSPFGAILTVSIFNVLVRHYVKLIFGGSSFGCVEYTVII